MTEKEWEDKGTCDKCGKLIPYNEEYVRNGGYCNECERGN